MQKRVILNQKQLDIILHRLALQIEENHPLLEHTALIGLQPRGVYLARKIKQKLLEITGKAVLYGELDSTFYRDDYRRTEKPLLPNSMLLNFEVEEKKVILIDDVLYTGRSVRSALNALGDFGRPSGTELMVLIDRRYNRELPIQPDYCGAVIDSRMNDRVKVAWAEEDNEQDQVWIISPEA